MNNHNLIIKELGERLKDQPVNMALTKRIIKALMSDTAMPAWRFFPDDTKTVGKVIDCVRQAWSNHCMNAVALLLILREKIFGMSSIKPNLFKKLSNAHRYLVTG